MNSDFEEYLRGQSFRPIPAQWRGEILRAARAQPAAAPWWREWLWPCPAAWAGLAAAWGIIFLLSATSPEEPAEARQAVPAPGWAFAMLRQETEIIAQLSGSEENRPALPPQPAALKPHSRRRVQQSIG